MEYAPSNRKRLPYGMMNFADIRLDNYYYVDKTAFIPLIEQSDRFFFFIRPRRFGKSLTLNMLQHYYDVRTRDKFDSLFGDLYIGKHPTQDRNTYLVLRLNFSGINGELHNYRQGLDAHCQTMFDYFCDIYADYLPEGIKEKLDEKAGAVAQLEYLFTECNKTEQKIYLFIDEYDHFTNAILSDVESLHRYTEETHKEDYLRAFFNKVKAGTDSSIKRCFITGVSPVTMDDLTSGFNIGTNYSLSPEFNEMTGFTEKEVREMLTYYSTNSPFNKTKLTIPNQVVEEQLYTYLLNTYNEAELSFSSYEKDELASALAYDGDWQAYFGYIADCLKRYASQRDKQKGEFFVHGFTLAMTAQNRFYRPISEADMQEGYADIFLCPLLEIYPDMKHCYIVELKYAKYKDSENRVEELRLEGIAQANRYADAERVKNAVGSTQLHKIVVVYKGMEMRVCEEIIQKI